MRTCTAKKAHNNIIPSTPVRPVFATFSQDQNIIRAPNKRDTKINLRAIKEVSKRDPSVALVNINGCNY